MDLCSDCVTMLGALEDALDGRALVVQLLAQLLLLAVYGGIVYLAARLAEGVFMFVAKEPAFTLSTYEHVVDMADLATCVPFIVLAALHYGLGWRSHTLVDWQWYLVDFLGTLAMPVRLASNVVDIVSWAVWHPLVFVSGAVEMTSPSWLTQNETDVYVACACVLITLTSFIRSTK